MPGQRSNEGFQEFPCQGWRPRHSPQAKAGTPTVPKITPSDAVLYNNRGGAKLLLGLKKEAILDFELAVARSNYMEPAFIEQLEGAKQSKIEYSPNLWRKYKKYWPVLILVFVVYFAYKSRKKDIPHLKTPTKTKSRRNRRKS